MAITGNNVYAMDRQNLFTFYSHLVRRSIHHGLVHPIRNKKSVRH